MSDAVPIPAPPVILDTAEPEGFPSWRRTRAELLLARALRGLLALAGAAADVVFFGSLMAVFGTVLANVFARTFLNHSLVWVTEIGQLCVPLMAFIGGARAYGMGRATAFTGLTDRLPAKGRQVAAVAAHLWVAVVAYEIAINNRNVISSNASRHSPLLSIPGSWSAIGLEAAMILVIAYAIRGVLTIRNLRVYAMAVAVLAVIGVIGKLVISSLGTFPSPGPSTAVAISGFVVSYVLGVPIVFVLLTSALLYVHVSQVSALQVVPSDMVSGVESVLMEAIPFFILAGVLLGEAGLTDALGAFIARLLRRLKGGMLHATIVMMYVFSGISGSKVADVSAVGTAVREPVRKAGHDAEELTVVLASSAIMGEVVPPSNAMLVLGSITTVSIGSLFKAGLIPAAVVGLLIAFVVYRRSSATMPVEDASSQRSLLRLFVGAFPSLAMPAVILGCIYSGIVAPTEASALAVLVGLIAVLGTRTGRSRTSISMLHSVEATAGFVLTIIGAAAAFSFTLSVAGLPKLIHDFFTSLGGGKWSILLASIVLLPILGLVLEGLPAILILAPLMLPIAENAGINGVQFSILLLLAIHLGTFSPPLGVGMFSTCQVTGASISKVVRRFVPYGLTILVALVLVAFVPQISTVWN